MSDIDSNIVDYYMNLLEIDVDEKKEYTNIRSLIGVELNGYIKPTKYNNYIEYSQNAQ